VGALGLSLAAQSREAGERLQKHEQFAGDLASLHENTIRCLSSGLVTVDRDGTITSINEAACEILGVSRKAGVGQALAYRVPGLSLLLEEVGLVGNVRRQEVDAMRPDGAVRRLGVSAMPLSDHTGRVIGRVIHFQDLTELRRMEVAVQRSERLASIGRLAAGVAHEIRNPLASISGSVEILRTLPQADDDTKNLIDITVREVDRLNELITALLDYARPPSKERGIISLSEQAQEVFKAFGSGIKSKRIDLQSDIDPNVYVRGSSGQLRQVLWNLLKNADESMPESGRITLLLGIEELTNGGKEAMLSITDTGVGISQTDQEHIFEPFFTKGKKAGTGLGLATVARAVEDHDGTIEVQSSPGKGTTFTLRLPLSRAPSRLPEEVNPSS
jgi:two-component system, NtrC family, sensor histidine kinase PilS